ncbi:hypothetical protein AURDEDRAFT_116536 [Auricularia subglabra TFB-10046 SS5]|nr:hypothetical protein AURDEDRAFT_116536 [Auricularia subglabra TFB-10046 SS5]
MQSPASSKPLPPLPLAPGLENLHRLSTAASNHLGATLRFALQAEALDQSWAALIRGALDEMADALARGRWIHGLAATHRARAAWAVDRERARRAAARDGADKDAVSATTSTSTSSVVFAGLDDKERLKRARADVVRLSNASHVPAPVGTPKHLLFTVAQLGPVSPMEDLDFDLVPNNRTCTFTAGSFILPPASSRAPDTAGHILYGLNEWHAGAFDKLTKDGVSLRLVGGTFSFGGVSSPEIYVSLVKVVRVAIYVRLSLLLEQRLLSGFHVQLTFPKLPTPPPTPSPLPSPAGSRASSPPPSALSNRRFARAAVGFRSAASSGIWSFISRKTESLLHRPASRSGYSSDGFSSQRQSLDIPAARHAQRWSEDDNTEGIETVRAAPAQYASGKFGNALKHLEEITPILTTSPNMDVPLPRVLVGLADREKENNKGGRRKRRLLLTGDERTALEDLQGWDEHDPFVFEKAFANFQQMTLLYSEHVPQPPRIVEPGLDSTLASITRCGIPRWVTYCFYAPRNDADETLGAAVERLCEAARTSCEACEMPRMLHAMTWIHDGVKVSVSVDAIEGAKPHPETRMWESCAACEARNPPMPMDDATYLYSFGKFLEMLAYSKTFSTIPLSLCEHTSLDVGHQSKPPSRHSILRHFARDGLVVTFATASMTEVFDLRVPRLQIIHDKIDPRELDVTVTGAELDPEQEEVRDEIRVWWDGLRIHLQELSKFFASEITMRESEKALPSEPITPSSHFDNVSPSNSPESPKSMAASTTLRSLSSVTQSPSSLQSSAKLLEELSGSFNTTEKDLYALLARTPATSLNDVRRAFASGARGIVKRLAAWQAKHAPAAVPFDKLKANEPDWWKAGCYAVPGGRVIVRDGEWGSIISCALSSTDYADELANMQAGRPSSRANIEATGDTRPSTPSVLSIGSTASRVKKPISKPLPDPDDETAAEAWHEAEPVATTTSRIDHARDVSTLLNLRDVLRHKRSVDSGTGSISSRFSSLGSSASRFINSISAPPSAWAKPAVEVSPQMADGKVSATDNEAEQALLQVVEQQLINKGMSPSEDETGLAGSGFVNVSTPRSTTPVSAAGHGKEGSTATIGPPVPPKDCLPSTPSIELTESELAHTAAASINSSLTTTLANAMRFVLSTGGLTEAPARRAGSIAHPLLGQAMEIDDSQPHIKYEFALGNRLRFSCTVYYARQFDELRRRCGIGEDMMQSLARSTGWAAAGGKSKANFWKTADDRFVIKSLVNAWNVADLQVLNETAPAYFAYFDSAASKASVLTKLLGYYTVEIKNLETGSTQARADLLVMENLFYQQTIAKTFDLKGIQGRKVKAKSKDDSNAARTLFDGEWIEGQQRALLLLRSPSKRVLQEAVKSDCDFLSKNNIMDYSLLLGIDQERKQIACGLVDTIGSYSFAKTLEYKAKQGLNNNLIVGSNKEVTVIPPAEYRDRFVKAIDGYFLACPDKWTKFPDQDSSGTSTQLYSIL